MQIFGIFEQRNRERKRHRVEYDMVKEHLEVLGANIEEIQGDGAWRSSFNALDLLKHIIL